MSRYTDTEVFELWLESQRSPRTVESYRLDLEQFFSFTKLPLSEIDYQHLQNYSTYLQNQKLKASSIRRKMNAIKSFFAFAVKRKHLPESPAAELKFQPMSPNLAGRVLTIEETMKLFDGAKPGRERILLQFIYITGCRVSEACGVQWNDFAQQMGGSWQVTLHGKGGKLRVVRIPSKLWELLQTIRGSNRPFPITRYTAHEIIKSAVEVMQLNPNISCHWLRHSHAVHAIHKGAKLQVIRDTLGHSSIATTNWYLESFPDESSSNFLDF